MIPVLRPYQSTLNTDIRHQWAGGAQNVLAVCPTGGGKTVCMSEIAQEHNGASLGIAHRQELVGQMSLAFARCGIRHRVIGPPALARMVVTIHMLELGRSFYDPNSWVGVAGVDTLIRRPADDPWFRQVTLWQTDEAHHVLANNKWGKACAMFPNARGVGWTATPGRADGYGLGRWADGLFDCMVTGPSMRTLIDQGYLTDYRIACPASDIDLTNVTVGASGEFSAPKLREALHKSRIVGDVVKHYLRFEPGKLGVTFAVDVEHATEMAQAYRAAGVSAEIVTSTTPDTARTAILRRFRNRDILQLVNVDLFGEGFDLPAIEVVSMARPTHSYTLYAQQFGRALRLLPGKSYGRIIDHVGNVVRHNGPPDRERSWSLDRRERKGAKLAVNGTPYRTCPECTAPYERFFHRCPFCGFAPEPAGRDKPEFVDGDLIELDGATLAALRGEVTRIDGAFRAPMHLDQIAVRAASNNWLARQQAQAPLRQVIALWAGWQRDQGRDDHEIYRRFYHGFGLDVMTAQTLGAKEAEALTVTVRGVLDNAGVVAA
jgi:DNA repair protein RadD